jgi:hypothetical protein
MTAKDLMCAEFIPASISNKYERHDEISEFAAGLRYLVKGTSAGLSLGFAFVNQPTDTILASVGSYLVADLVYQAGYELKNYAKGNSKLDACEQPATLLVEMGYNAGKGLANILKEYY